MKHIKSVIILSLCQISSLMAGDLIKPLEFVMIHKEPFKGSEPVLVQELELEGFRAIKPNLVVKKLQKVTMRPDKRKSMRMNRDGTNKVEGINNVFLVSIKLEEGTQKAFAKLTSEATGTRLLISIDGQALLAPFVMTEINVPSFEVSFSDESVAKKVFKALKDLTKNKQNKSLHPTASS